MPATANDAPVASHNDVPDLPTALSTPIPDLLERAAQRGRESQLDYAGSLYPTEAWALVQQGAARLVDVRTAEELKFVGHVPDSLHVAWQTGQAMIKNPRFLRELEIKAGKQLPIVLLCRSGKRSAEAAKAATSAGFEQVYNILEGFEGNLDPLQRRGDLGGWRHRGLPWVQD